MRTLFILVGLTVTSNALAEATTQEFLTEHRAASDDGRRYLEGFLQGLVAGYRASNMTLKAKGQPLLTRGVSVLDFRRASRRRPRFSGT